MINYEITYHGIGLSFNKLFHSLLAHLHILHILFIDLFIIYSILNTLWRYYRAMSAFWCDR